MTKTCQNLGRVVRFLLSPYASFTMAAFVWTAFLMALLFGPRLFAQEDALRTWTDQSGRFSVEARLLSYEDGRVRLQKSNGKTIALDAAKLSAADQKWLEEYRENPFTAGEESDGGDDANGNSGGGNSGGAESGTGNFSGPRVRIEELGMAFPSGDWSKGKKLIASGEKTPWKVTPDLAGSVENAAPDAFPPAIRLRTAPEFQNEPSLNDERLFFADPAPQRALVVFTIGMLEKRRDFLEICDLAKGESRLMPIPFPMNVWGLSPDGTKAIGVREYKPSYGGFNHKEILCVLDITGEKPKVAAQMLPYVSPETKKNRMPPEGSCEGALWTGEERVLTKRDGEITFWNLETLAALWSINADEETVSLSPNRKLVAFGSGTRVEIRSSEEGDLLGALDNGTQECKATQFSPDGKKLAILLDDALRVADLSTGNVTSETPVLSKSFGKTLLWTGAETLLVNGVLYDTAAGVPLCVYRNLTFKSDAVAQSGGRVWTVLSSGFGAKQMTALVSAQLPQPEAAAFFQKLDMEKQFAIHPGSKVRLTLNLNQWADEAKTREMMTERLRDKKLTVDPNAEIEVKVTYADTGEETQVGYAQGSGGFPTPLMPPMLSRRELGSIKLKVFSQKIEFEC